MTDIKPKNPSLCQRMLAWLGFIGVFISIKDGFALRLVLAACVRSPVSPYHTVISHQVGSCDLRFQYVQCRGLNEEDRKYVFTHPSTGHENNEATSALNSISEQRDKNGNRKDPKYSCHEIQHGGESRIGGVSSDVCFPGSSLQCFG